MHTYIYELNITSVKRWYLVNRANTACMVSGLSSLKWSMTYAGIGWVDSNCSTHAKDKQKRRSDLRTLHLQYIQRINSTNTNTHTVRVIHPYKKTTTYIHTYNTYIRILPAKHLSPRKRFEVVAVGAKIAFIIIDARFREYRPVRTQVGHHRLHIIVQAAPILELEPIHTYVHTYMSREN